MKLNPEVYRRAAERIASGESEDFIHAIESIGDSSYVMDFIKAIQLGTRYFGPFSVPENQLARSLALLLMAEIVESENGSI